MTTEEIQARVASLRQYDFRGAEKLAREILQDARVPLHALHRLLPMPDPFSTKARSVLRALEELSILPLLVGAQKLSGTHRLQAVADAARAHERSKERILQVLRQMLRRSTVLPPPSLPGPVEMTPTPTRECDEAYVLLRRLQKPDETEASYQEFKSACMRASEQERDRLISRVPRTEDTGKRGSRDD